MATKQTSDCPFDGPDRRAADTEHAIRIALLEQGMESIKVQLSGINSNMSKLVWLVFSVLVLAGLKLIILPM